VPRGAQTQVNGCLQIFGKLMAIVHSTTTPGNVTLKATSGSLTSGSVAITTEMP
jgi:hypothetical protein